MQVTHTIMKESTRGFTLIEILIVIGMLAILATVVLVAVNPLRQFAQARNSQRQANVSALLNAVSNRIADNRGVFEAADCTALPVASSTGIKKQGGYDLRKCLVPDYISELPFDPSVGSNTCTTDACSDPQSYATAYTIEQHTSSSRITICAPGAKESAIKGSEAFCLTR